MLGSIKFGNLWKWAAYGKHPIAKDYFQVGSAEPLLMAFSDWAKAGYRLIAKVGNKEIVRQNSWRFWAQGPQKKDLICGVGKDSSDSFGRSYPLLIVGIGPLKKWDRHWELLVFALENTWRQIEYLSAKRFMDFKQLEDGVRMISPPVGDWPEFKSKIEQVESDETGFVSTVNRNFRDLINKLSNKPEFFIPLETESVNDQLRILNLCHLLLKKGSKIAPHAVFMGGRPQKVFLALFNRPLKPYDFARLWMSCSEDIKNEC
jgi:type VI secretion system ImpM family protein